MKLARLIIISTGISSALSANLRIGGVIPFTYNAASAQTSTTEFRLGVGLAARYDIKLAGETFEVLAAFSKNQLLTQSVNGESRADLCTKTFVDQLFSFPGACTQYQFRWAALYRWSYGLSAGFSLTYNHITNLTYNSTEIYNTNWSYWGLGPTITWAYDFYGVLVMPAMHVDFSIDSKNLSTEKISAFQWGGLFYVLAKIF